ncbi:NTP transferase domain-containing protein [Candidatus Acetothermia bacterium]|nr:NTP transferase domain-containing protein [Candidatus Acetothermia bacterium]MBI3642759.1 NTP transferase domain-containing protein [Candidatus Acetothermia bacterium]
MQAVLLAAGESSRFWPLSEGKHKSLFYLMGKPLIQWTLEGLERVGIDEVVIIQSSSCLVEKTLKAFQTRLNLSYVVQEEPKGMGDALLSAKKVLRDSFFLLHAHQFTADQWLTAMMEKQNKTSSKLILSGQPTNQPRKYGMLKLENERVVGIVEKPSSEDAPSDIRALGIYLLTKKLVRILEKSQEHPYAFEDALNGFMAHQDVRVVIQDVQSISLKYPWDLFDAIRILMKRHLKPYCARSAQISPLAHIEGDVFIGENAKIFEYAVIKGPCYIGDGCVIGTHSLVRDHTDVESGAVIGAHAEVARCIFQTGSSSHSGYFGDSIFDQRTKIGAGTVTANVKIHRDEIKPVVKEERLSTGRHALGVIVGCETQLGISVKTMPGTLVGAFSFVGPGVIVEENVPSETRLLLKQEKLIKNKRRRS